MSTLKQIAATRAWQKLNPDRVNEHKLKWKLENVEKAKLVKKEWNKRNPEMNIWCNAKKRCTVPTTRSYKDYGGRGIEFRLKSYRDIVDTIGKRPDKTYQFDRIDNNGHYEVGNIRWATSSEQMKNRRPFTRVNRRKVCPAM